MKPTTMIAAVLLLSLSLASGADASLIDDEVTVQYIENNILREQRTFTVSEEDNNIPLGFGTIRLDIQADSVIINFVGSNSYDPGLSTFFGIKILGLDWQDPDNPDWILLGADITNNTMPDADLWYAQEDQRLLIDPTTGSIGFDWHQMSYDLTDPRQNFTAMLEFGPNPIPLPATMALFVTGLIGFIIVRRKKKG